jgi:hypothetical protein
MIGENAGRVINPTFFLAGWVDDPAYLRLAEHRLSAVISVILNLIVNPQQPKA